MFTRPSAGPETLTVALLGLLAYFAAEALGLSAILSVFFCGIAMSHYTWHNLSPPAKVGRDLPKQPRSSPARVYEVLRCATCVAVVDCMRVGGRSSTAGVVTHAACLLAQLSTVFRLLSSACLLQQYVTRHALPLPRAQSPAFP